MKIQKWIICCLKHLSEFREHITALNTLQQRDLYSRWGFCIFPLIRNLSILCASCLDTLGSYMWTPWYAVKHKCVGKMKHNAHIILQITANVLIVQSTHTH